MMRIAALVPQRVTYYVSLALLFLLTYYYQTCATLFSGYCNTAHILSRGRGSRTDRKPASQPVRPAIPQPLVLTAQMPDVVPLRQGESGA